MIKNTSRLFIGLKEPRARLRDLLIRSSGDVAHLTGHDDIIFTYKARGALNLVLDKIASDARKEVLLPAYICPSVVQTVERSGLKPVFYPLAENLDTDIDSIEKKVSKKTLAVLQIHYFGFESNTAELSRLCHAYNIPLIEDWSHSFLQTDPLRLAGTCGDYQIYSLWKIAPCGVGGALRILNGEVINANLSYPRLSVSLKQLRNTIDFPGAAFLEAIRAYLYKNHTENSTFDTIEYPVNDERYSTWYPKNNDDFCTKIPIWALRLLKRWDLAEIVSLRRANYQRYLDLFSNIDGVLPLVTELPSSACPWAFPVLLQQRDELAPRMRDAGVPLFTFGETMHPAQELTLAKDTELQMSVKYLIDTCLCLPLHQDITQGMIDEYAHIATKVISRKA